METTPISPGEILLGKYCVERVLGQGGMGIVVAARHLELGELFAIKFLLPHVVSNKQAVERFQREARAASRLKGEHVAKVTDVGRLPDGAPYMVMEYLEGSDLNDVLKAKGAFSLEDACVLVFQACEAIAEAHGAGIIHRDIKPANLFLTRRANGTPCIKVLDFGISKQTTPDGVDLTKTGARLGSPLYMSPEQMIRTKNVDSRSDVWALGVVLYELATAARPFLADTLHEVVALILQTDPEPPSHVRPELPAWFDAVVARCLAKLPADRFQTVDELAAAIHEHIAIPGRLASTGGALRSSAGVINESAGPASGSTTGATSGSTTGGAGRSAASSPASTPLSSSGSELGTTEPPVSSTNLAVPDTSPVTSNAAGASVTGAGLSKTGVGDASVNAEPQRPPGKTGLAAGAAIGLVALIAGGAWFALRSPPKVPTAPIDSSSLSAASVSAPSAASSGAPSSASSAASPAPAPRRPPPKDLHPTSIAAGGYHTCALMSDGGVKCWGYNGEGELGLGDFTNRGEDVALLGTNLPEVDLGADTIVTFVAAGGYHSCVVRSDGRVFCWGDNKKGQLGLGDTDARGEKPNEMGASLPAVDLGPGRSATSVAVGVNHTCALLTDGAVVCWGDNTSGQLGQGDTSIRGDEAKEMGASLPAVDLGPGSAATAVAAGEAHTCALLKDGSVKCWGDNKFGQLGLGDAKARGDEPGEMGAALPAALLGAGKTATAIAAGKSHTCVILNDGAVKCWGDNAKGQLGVGDTAARGDGPNEMGSALLPVNLGIGKAATAISAGDAHTCALLADNRLKCWGSNDAGQLGQGSVANRGDGPNEMGEILTAVNLGAGRVPAGVAAGGTHTCARTADNGVTCWGSNGFGQLGQGGTANRGDAPNEMGDALIPVNLVAPAP